MALMLPPVAVWLHHQPGAVKANQALYDRMLAWRTPAANAQMLVIGIDARSLREIGPWPWPRRVHAELLARLAPHEPRSVLLDLFFESPSADDALLAEAMKDLPVFLPQRFEDFDPHSRAFATPHLVPPTPLLAEQARGQGHASMTTDGDDIVRWLRAREGVGARGQPYVGLAMAGQVDTYRPGAMFGFALAGPAGSYPTVPYVSVWRGEVPPELLRGRDLLVGAVQDAAIGDNVPVSLGGRPALLPGVELHANAIAALHERRTITPPSMPVLAAWIALPVWLSLLLFLRLARQAALVAGLLALIWIGLSVLALAFAHRWLPPFMPVVGIGLAYVLWSWRRMHALLGVLRLRIDSLNAVPAGAFEAPLLAAVEPRALDAVDQQTDALDRAVHRLAQLQALLAEGLWRMPTAVLLCRDDGRILQSNAQARHLLRPARTTALGESTLLSADDPLAQADLLHLLASLSFTPIDGQAVGHVMPAAWQQAASREYTTAEGRVLRVQSAPIQSCLSPPWGADARALQAPGQGVRIVQLHDLSVERQAQQERARWLGFLSHDLRSPQVTILNLLTLHAERGVARGEPPPMKAIRREAERTLSLTEGFIDLIEAESSDYCLSDLDPAAIVLDAVEQATSLAQLKGVRLHLSEDGMTDEAGDIHTLVHGNGSLLQRAFYNLLSNALRHSPAGGQVRVCMAAHRLEGERSGTEVVIAIIDEGEGMEPQRLAQLLAPQQGSDGAHAPDAGSPARRRGIGFAVAKTVVLRHGGWLDAHSAPGQGCAFFLGLPAVQIDEGALSA